MLQDNFKLNIKKALENLKQNSLDMNSEILTVEEFEEHNENIIKANTLSLNSELINK